MSARFRSSFPLLVLALGAFVLGTSELAVAGLLPWISADLGVTTGTAGGLVTAYAAAVALLGPPLAAILRGVSRRHRLLAALGAQLVGNGITAVATDLPVLFAARALTGAGAALYAVTAISLATALVGPDRRGRAVSLVFGSITLATVVGVPAGTALGELLGWRVVYGTLTVATAVVLGCAPLAVRGSASPAPADAPADAPGRLADLPWSRLRVPFAVNAVVTAGHYAAATYLVALLTEETGIGPAAVTALLVTTGVASAAGTFLGGAAADRDTRRAVVGAAAGTAGGLAVLSAVMSLPALAWPAILVWHAAFSAFSTAAQVAVSERAPGADLPAATNISVFNTGIAAGSSLGGLLLPAAGFPVLTLTAAALPLAGLLLLAARSERAGAQGRGLGRIRPVGRAARPGRGR
ncbi:MFS transporter [Streptomyces sp. B6B3]|uniref:MFS transporter n=1 Tax=Streptomyces sp. B6B3 TaxID=3153570 RepID=UPI00325DF166